MIAAVAAALAVAAAPAMPARITPHRVGDVKLGESYAALHKAGQVGRLRRGCELDNAGNRAAVLRNGVRGVVELTPKPRRVKSIVAEKNVTARGLVIGDTRAAVKDAYPKAKFDESVQTTFGITLVRIPKNGGGPIQIALNAKSDKISEFGIPYIKFCE